MLRVGLTGGLGSGKSTVGARLRALGAEVVEADELARAMMQPGQPVFDAIVEQFGRGVVGTDGSLDRAALAQLAFAEGRLAELNAIVHPAVIARQAELAQLFLAQKPEGVFVVESALLFETIHAGAAGWRERFDRVLLVTAAEPLRVERYVHRVLGDVDEERLQTARAEARRRMAAQMTDVEKVDLADVVLVNEGTIASLVTAVDAVWPVLVAAARAGALLYRAGGEITAKM